MTIQTLVPVEYSAQRVVTTAQVADFYDCPENNIIKNFNANKDKFKEGIHLFKLEGEALKEFKNSITESNLVGVNAKSLILWTKRGCARHAKMLGTDKAWEVFEELEENYFNSSKTMAVTSAQKELDEIILSVGKTREAIQKVYGVKDGIALAQATNLAGAFYKFNLSELNKLIPPADHETGYMNATQLGKKVGKSAMATNKWLEKNGYQYKDGRDWRLTAKGKQYAEEIPYDTGKHSGYQIRWSLPTAELFL